MQRRTFLAAGVALGLAAPAIVRAQGTTSVKFVVDFAYQGNHAIWGLALARDMFAKQGLAVTMDRGYGSGDTIVKVASGAYDIGFADINAAVKFNAQNPDKRVISIFQGFDRTLSAIITLKKSGIAVPKDLVGHTVGAPEADASRLLFPAFARANKFDAAGVTWRNIAPNLRETILVQGQVDAISGFTSTSLFNLVNVGVKREDVVLLPFASNGLDLYGNAVIMREDYLAAHPEVARGFVKGTIDGTIALIKDKAAGLATMKARDPLFDIALEGPRLDLVLSDAILTPNVRQFGFGYIDPARMALTISANAEAYGLTTPPTPEQLYTVKFLPPQAERMPPV
jgi:NitT/TauT family transport system substrate-binding protein